MKSAVSVTKERRIAAAPDVIWRVISTPQMHERLDPRCCVESTTGGYGAGSQYVFVVRTGLKLARLRSVVREAIPHTKWIADVDKAGSMLGSSTPNSSVKGEAPCCAGP